MRLRGIISRQLTTTTTTESQHHQHSHSKLLRNVTILGPPGSGKGFYGKFLAHHFHAPLLSASSILRESGKDVSTGHLLDDHQVARILQKYLVNLFGTSSRQRHHHYFLDGFPRTPQQITLMEEQWHIRLQAHICLHLPVPDAVCHAKMLGRRHCRLCGNSHNTANVQHEDFDLPPQEPKHNPICVGCETHDYTTRADDTPTIIQHRLEQYRSYEKDILDFYRQEGRLVQFTPHKGEKDVPRLCMTLEEWMEHN